MEMLFIFFDYILINIEDNYLITLALFFIFLSLYFSLSLPGNIILIAATGYFFGIYVGYILSIITLVLGSLVFFIFNNFFIKKLFPNIISKYTHSLQSYISNSSIEYLIIFRIIPGPPLFLQNLLLSFLKISKKIFIISTFIGFSPLVFIVVFIGSQLTNVDKIQNLSINDIFSFKFLFLIIVLIIFLVIRIFFKRN